MDVPESRAGSTRGGTGRGVGRGVLTRRQAAEARRAVTLDVVVERASAVVGPAVPRARRGGVGQAACDRDATQGAVQGCGQHGEQHQYLPREMTPEEAPGIIPEEVDEVGPDVAIGGVAIEEPMASVGHTAMGQHQAPVRYVMLVPARGEDQLEPGVDTVSQQTDGRRAARLGEFARLGKDRFGRFSGRPDPMAAREWLAGVEDTFAALGCVEAEKVDFATFFLAEQARVWWRAESIALGGEASTWSIFRDAFLRKYFPDSFRLQKRTEFLNIEQGSRGVAEYAADFEMMAEFAPSLVVDERERAEHFMRGLRFSIRDRLSGLDVKSYQDIVSRALRIEQTQEDIFQRRQQSRPVRQTSAPTQQQQRAFAQGGQVSQQQLVRAGGS